MNFAYAADYQQGTIVTRDDAMFYVQRDAEGQLLRVEAAPYAEHTEILPADHAEIQEWFADDVVENSLKQLKQSDLDMIRVLEDLIEVLTAKGVFSITDLPPGAQAKLLSRSTARKALGSLNNLIEDEEEGGLI
ncbi:hypothetical protein BR1R5_05560 [Pseudomonas sp. BR1R-5]|jgi:hypothetical protein|nr:hypothetical protein [Pseudomonas sp. M2]MBM7398410.1 hypothetical protein [Pseudomonas sp. M5]GLH31170.1 hypothetical protein BR1R5_05560 [Pseudomonas sp. BR1R-5]